MFKKGSWSRRTTRKINVAAYLSEGGTVPPLSRKTALAATRQLREMAVMDPGPDHGPKWVFHAAAELITSLWDLLPQAEVAQAKYVAENVWQSILSDMRLSVADLNGEHPVDFMDASGWLSQLQLEIRAYEAELAEREQQSQPEDPN